MPQPDAKTQAVGSQAPSRPRFEEPNKASRLAQNAPLRCELNGSLRDRLVSYHTKFGLPGTRPQDTLRALLESALNSGWSASTYVRQARIAAYRNVTRVLSTAFGSQMQQFSRDFQRLLEELAARDNDAALDQLEHVVEGP